MENTYLTEPHLEHIIPRQRCPASFKLITIALLILMPIMAFCAIYMILFDASDSILYPKSNIFKGLPTLWIKRAEIYSNARRIGSQFNDNVDLQRAFIPTDKPEYKLVCYYTFPDLTDFHFLMVESIDPFLCTHINVGFVGVTNSTVHFDRNQDEVVQAVANLKQKNVALKVLLSIGGAGNGDGFAGMVSDHANRKTFIRSVLDLLKHYKIDGVDLDWEYPNANEKQRIHFVQLLGEFRRALDRSGFGGILSVAVAAPNFLVDLSYDVTEMNQYVDYINLMSYDYHFYTKFTPFTGLNAPLYQTGMDDGYLATLNVNYSANYWYAKGMDRNKIIIGIPTYGHTFRLTNPNNNGIYAPAYGYGKLGSNGFADYNQICQFLILNQIKPIFDLDAKCPYAYKSNEWISFDDEQSVVYKAEFIRDQQFGGAMILSLNADDHEGNCRLNNDLGDDFPLTRNVHKVLNANFTWF